jgi:hypothetical protein
MKEEATASSTISLEDFDQNTTLTECMILPLLMETTNSLIQIIPPTYCPPFGKIGLMKYGQSESLCKTVER